MSEQETQASQLWLAAELARQTSSAANFMLVRPASQYPGTSQQGAGHVGADMGGGHILAMEGLLMDAWKITGGQLGGGGGKAKARGGGGSCPPLEPPMLHILHRSYTVH